MPLRTAKRKRATRTRRESSADLHPHPAVSIPVSDQLHILMQVLVAMFLGGLVGWEREAAGKFAGLRTHMLMAVSAMLFVGMGQLIVHDAGGSGHGDPVRAIEAIATGVAFIGAGTIFRDRTQQAKGLTTAASLLVTSSIGIAVALDGYVIAVGVTIICLIILRMVAWVEKKLSPDNSAGGKAT